MKTFCLYEASSTEDIREAARQAGIPVDTIIEVGDEIVPTGSTDPCAPTGSSKIEIDWQ